MAILGDSELDEALAGRRNWRRSGDSLVRERALRDFAEALAYVARIGEVVEDYGRHPDIAITGGNRVRVTVANANGAGFTEAELRMVEKVDEVADAPVPVRGPIAAVVTPVAPVSPVAAPPAPVMAEAPAVVPAVAPDPEPEQDHDGRRGRRGVVLAAVGAGLAAGAATVVATRRR